MTLTPFWHRRICEAIFLIDAIVLGLFAWAKLVGINQPDGAFNITILPVSLSVVGIILAIVSYFLKEEKSYTTAAVVAYAMTVSSVLVLVIQTGGTESAFIALWMITSLFAASFGLITLLALVGVVALGSGYMIVIQHMSDPSLISTVMLAGFLPLVMSYVLWHNKTKTEKSNERAYNDITKELDQASSKAEIVINAISDGVIAINNSGQIELINPAAQRIVGWGNQDALNLDYKSVLKLLSEEDRELDKSTDPVFAVLSTNQSVHRSDVKVQTSSGRKIDSEIFVSPLGQLGSGAIIVFRDIAKEKADSKAQAEFISTASHEMRTPVASIEGYLGLALNPNTAQIDEKAREFVTKAHASAEHLGQLFQDLLDITKAEDGRLQNNPKVVDLVSFTYDIIDSLRMKAEEKGLRVFFKPTDNEDSSGLRTVTPVYYVNLDNGHLREVLSNLVENAIKYTPSGQVFVDIQNSDKDDDHVVISIKDSGIGIPAEDIPHLFQKFYRVDNSDTREIGGTGLGLYLCRRLVEAMEGRLWVDSEYKQGSTFYVELPRISHIEASRLIEAAETQQISSSKSILGDNKPGDAPGSQAVSIYNTATENSAAAPTSNTTATPAQSPAIVRHDTPTVTAEAQPAPSTTPRPTTPAVTPQPIAQAAPALPAAQPSPQPTPPVTPQSAMQTQPVSTTPITQPQATSLSTAGGNLPIINPAPKPTVTPAPDPKQLIQNFIQANPARPAPTITPNTARAGSPLKIPIAAENQQLNVRSVTVPTR